MNKKLNEQQKAVDLRIAGCSINQIADELKVSKGSVSSWVKNIKLSDELKNGLTQRAHTRQAVEKRRLTRLRTEKSKRDEIELKAQLEIKEVTKHELWLIGTMLYWAEGGKTQRMVRFSNGDPEMIRVMMRYFQEICNVPKSKIRGYIHIHEHLDVEEAEYYWQKISQLPSEHFYKTFRKAKTLSKRKTLPYGVMDIYIMDTKLFLKIRGWTNGIYKSIN